MNAENGAMPMAAVSGGLRRVPARASGMRMSGLDRPPSARVERPSCAEPPALRGPRSVLVRGQVGYPAALSQVSSPPKRLYVVGDPAALEEGIAVVGARKATPYGMGCAARFARQAAERGIVVISGGARGCDAAAHEAALDVGGRTVAFLGGGCDRLYPAQHKPLFQRIVDGGGAVVSEHAWDAPPLPQQFRTRNRLIAGLARATLIVEAGLPSGTFSTADEALAANRDVLVVPGAITAASSRGANRLIGQGATPIVDDESFEDALLLLFGCLRQESWGAAGDTPLRQPGRVRRAEARGRSGAAKPGAQGGAGGNRSVSGKRTGRAPAGDAVARALAAEPLGLEELYMLARRACGRTDPRAWLMRRLAEGERRGEFARYPDGRWGPKGDAR